MALQGQTAALFLTRGEDRDDIVAPLIRNEWRRKTGMPFKCGGHGWDALRRQAQPLINPRHFIQCRGFIAKRGGATHQAREHGDALRAQLIHSFQNGAPRTGVESLHIAWVLSFKTGDATHPGKAQQARCLRSGGKTG